MEKKEMKQERGNSNETDSNWNRQNESHSKYARTVTHVEMKISLERIVELDENMHELEWEENKCIKSREEYMIHTHSHSGTQIRRWEQKFKSAHDDCSFQLHESYLHFHLCDFIFRSVRNGKCDAEQTMRTVLVRISHQTKRWMGRIYGHF